MKSSSSSESMDEPFDMTTNDRAKETRSDKARSLFPTSKNGNPTDADIRRLAVVMLCWFRGRRTRHVRGTTKWKFRSNLLRVYVHLISRGLIVYLSALHMRRRCSPRGGAVASAPACQSPYQEPAAQSKKAEPHYACHALFALFRSAVGCALAVLKMPWTSATRCTRCRFAQKLKLNKLLRKLLVLLCCMHASMTFVWTVFWPPWHC